MGTGVAEHALTYASHPTDVETYRNKSVLILGRGNAAFEVASHILHVTSKVHLAGRHTGRVRLATESHYPGDVRHVHSRLLETYLLKSQDGMAEMPFDMFRLTRNETDGRFYPALGDKACPMDDLGRPTGRCPFPQGYDVVISCSGWKFDASPFDPEIRPAMAPNGKHPALTAEYGAPGVPGLYFAGTAAHAADFRVSSGGFIHGFRYVVRALHRHLEEVEQASWASSDGGAEALHPPPASWPRRRVSGLRSAVSALLRRANHAAGPFQMFGTLADVLVLPPVSSTSVDGFSGVEARSPFVEPSSFYDPAVTDPVLHEQHQPPPVQPGDAASQSARRSEAALDSALAGAAMFEEVPIRLAHLKAPGWASQLAASATGRTEASPLLGGGADYITLTLEFGGGKKAGGPHRRPGGRRYDYGLPSIEPAAPAGMGASSDKGADVRAPVLPNGPAALTALKPYPARGSVGAGALFGHPAAVDDGLDDQAREDMMMAAKYHGYKPNERLTLLPPSAHSGGGGAFGAAAGSSRFSEPPSDLLHSASGYGDSLTPEDPFSRARANVSFWEPERSRFLHPVLRYYHTRMAPGDLAPGEIPPPLLELHLVEDFDQSFTWFYGHVLSLARFLQDVAARRVRAAKAIAAAPSEAQAHAALASALAFRPLPHAGVASQLRMLMELRDARLYYGGVELQGGESWFHALSMEAAGALLAGHFERFGDHWADATEASLHFPEASSAWQALQVVGGNAPSQRASPPAEDDARGTDLLSESLLRAYFRNQTLAQPSLVVLSIRVGPGSDASEVASSLRVPMGTLRLLDPSTLRELAALEPARVAAKVRKWVADVLA